MWLLSLVLSPLSACRPAALRPADPTQPRVRPELAGCTWEESGEQYAEEGGSYRPAFTLVEAWDAEGRLTERTWSTRTALPDGTERTSESTERLTWNGRCPTESWYEAVHRYAALPDSHVSVSSRTSCDRDGNPVELVRRSRTETTGGNPPTTSESVTRYANTYEAGRLVERARLDELGQPTGFVERFRWDGERPVYRSTSNTLTAEGAALAGEAGEDGVLTEEFVWTWDGDRLVEEASLVEVPQVVLTVRTHRYDDRGRWIGEDSTAGPDRSHQEPSYRVRYDYPPYERFPIRQQQENTDPAVTYDDRIEVSCE